MSKKINVKTITPVSVANLSDYSVATQKLTAIAKKYREDKAVLDEELQKIKDARKKALEGGMSIDDAVVKFSTLEVENKLDALKVATDETKKPYVKAVNDVLKMIDPNFYPAYVLYTQTANTSATGEVEIKEGKKDVKYAIGRTQTFKAITRKFLADLGVTYTDDEKAMDNAMKSIIVWTSGMMQDKKTGGLKFRNKSDLRNVLVRACIKFFVEKNVLAIAEDGTITKVEKKAE